MNKKKLLALFLLIFSSLTYSLSLDKQKELLQLEKDRQSIKKVMREMPRIEFVMNDYLTADYSMQEYYKLGRKKIGSYVLLYPKVEILAENIGKISDLSNETEIYLFEKDYGIEELKGRSYEDLKKIKIASYPNVKIKIFKTNRERALEMLDTYANGGTEALLKVYDEIRKNIIK